jgi:hypothetical protein
MNTLLTVDFDFFIPEKPEWDLGHREAEMFLKMLWTFRGRYMKEMQTNGKELTFWDTLQPMFPIKPGMDVFVSDSHLYAYPLAEEAELIINFDRHHDCYEWPTMRQRHVEKKWKVDCGNWVSTWLSMDAKRKALWVYPDDLNDPERDGDILDLKDNVHVRNGDRFEAMPYSALADWAKLLHYTDDECTVHICRSGCWTPPWLDQKFIDFVKGSGFKPQVMQDGVWDPMTLRWDLDDYQTAARMQEEYEKLRAEANKDRL